MLRKISVLLLGVLFTSVLVLPAEIGDFGRSDAQSEAKIRHKRFIIQFQVPSPVGHFQVAMMPPFISKMMANIPNMIRRNFLFGSFQQQQQPQQEQTSPAQYEPETTEPFSYYV